jgi:hypothetical protein
VADSQRQTIYTGDVSLKVNDDSLRHTLDFFERKNGRLKKEAAENIATRNSRYIERSVYSP